MIEFEIVAHRGVPTQAPENTVASFQRALDLGADAIELDVRLTADRVPVVYHYFQLEENTSARGAIFDFSFEQLQQVRVFPKHNLGGTDSRISSLIEILEIFAGKIGLEIEIKGPEAEAPEIIGEILLSYQSGWDRMEITSYEPALLLAIQRICPGIPADLLFPRSQNWMTPEVVQYLALHTARLAGARAVHLHPSQLSADTVASIQRQGIDIHAWDVNDEQSLELIASLEIPRICTDHFTQALDFRNRLARADKWGDALEKRDDDLTHHKIRRKRTY